MARLYKKKCVLLPDENGRLLPGTTCDDHIPPNVILINKGRQPIVEALTAETQKKVPPHWGSSGPIIIQAPPGFGKTYAIMHKLIPYCIEYQQCMLIASNRIALSCQMKREIMKLTKDPQKELLTDKGVREQTDFGFGFVKIYTLQALPAFMNSEEGKSWCEGVAIAVVDEAHYFAADSSFNSGTDYLLEQFPQIFAHAQRIYMTGTPEDILYPLEEVEKNAWEKVPEEQRRNVAETLMMRSGQIPYSYQESLYVYLYRFDPDYHHIDIHYFKEDKALIAKIANTPVEEKWLIFIYSKAQGADMRKKLTDKELANTIDPEDVAMLTADDKRETCSTWKSLIEKEKLDKRITLATTVIDCGVNICDEALKHIVIYSIDKTSFIQCLGRKRCKKGERVNLYVPVLSGKRLSQLRQDITRQLDVIQTIEAGPEDKKEELWYKLHEEPKLMYGLPLHYPYKKGMCLNDIAAFSAERNDQKLTKLQKRIDEFGDSAFPRLVHEWLEVPDGYDEQNWLEYNSADSINLLKDALMEELKTLCKKEISDEGMKDALRQKIVELASRAGLKPRHDRTYQARALSGFLEQLKVPYELKESKGAWVVTEVYRPTPEAADKSEDEEEMAE